MDLEEMRKRAEDVLGCPTPTEGALAADVLALLAENEQLRSWCDEGREAKKILAELMRRTHSEGPVDGTGFGATGLAVDMTMEVLLGHLDNPAVENLVSFEIVKSGEKKAVVTVQRPTGASPIELLRAANAERDALKAEVERLREFDPDVVRQRRVDEMLDAASR